MLAERISARRIAQEHVNITSFWRSPHCWVRIKKVLDCLHLNKNVWGDLDTSLKRQ